MLNKLVFLSVAIVQWQAPTMASSDNLQLTVSRPASAILSVTDGRATNFFINNYYYDDDDIVHVCMYFFGCCLL